MRSLLAAIFREASGLQRADSVTVSPRPSDYSVRLGRFGVSIDLLLTPEMESRVGEILQDADARL